MSRDNMTDLFIEIGCEELPPHQIVSAVEHWRATLWAALADARLLAEEASEAACHVWSTPRRMAIHIPTVRLRQPNQQVTERGPAVAAAYTPDGEPTTALEGFARRHGVSMRKIQRMQTKRGEYVCIEQQERGRSARQLLGELVPTTIAAIPWSKRMRWEEIDLPFARPIRWVAALLGGRVLPLTVAGCKARATTHLSWWSTARPVRFASADEYVTVLRERGVLVNHEERREMIRQQLVGLATEVGAQPVWGEGGDELLDEVTDLVERPFSFSGTFQASYLDLPYELVVSSLSKYQRLFAVTNTNGALQATFLAVADGKPGDVNRVRSNFARVLDARLKDSALFYEEDQQRPLAERVDDLQGLSFLPQLGSMYDKAERLQQLTLVVAQGFDVTDEDALLASRAGRLAKADLTTSLVKEFPSLQGVVGGNLSDLSGEPGSVGQAIRHHYRPVSADDAPPPLEDPLGACLSIADKLDSVVGCLGVGLVPTGSADPYAVRRSATGLLMTAWHHRLGVSLSDVVGTSLELYGDQLDQRDLRPRILDFCRERLVAWLQIQGQDMALLGAVMQPRWEHIGDLRRRLEALKQTQAADGGAFLDTAKILERTGNILRSSQGESNAAVQVELFDEPAEQELWNQFEGIRQTVNQHAQRYEIAEATATFATLVNPVDRFFDQVMVNVEDQAVRFNRLAMMRAIHTTFAENIADLSELAARGAATLDHA